MDINLGFTVHLPADVTFLKTMTFVVVFSIGMFILALLARILLGKNSSLKFALSSGLSMIMLYAMCVIIFCFSPKDFTNYLNQLALGTFGVTENGDKVFALNSLRYHDLPELCYYILRIYLLAVMINMLGSYTPDKLKLLGWIVFRLFCLGVAIGLNYAVYKVIDMFMPFVFKQYAPMILLTILAFSFCMGFIKFLLGLLLTAVNPIFGAFYAFFFTNKFGKNMSRAIGSTLVICLMVLVFEHLGYSVIPIGPEALSSYIPFAISMFILWIIVGRVL